MPTNEHHYLPKILSFLSEIGIPVHEKTLPPDTFLPGLDLGPGCLHVDFNQLKYPGDLLHEAGHLAVTTPEQRTLIGTDAIEQPWPTDGEEIVAVLWSFAAAKHIDLPLNVLFHPNGYKGQSDWLIESFESGTYVGLPLLEWMGLTGPQDSEDAFPKMKRWLRV
ncbi:MAG: hypothetical protein A3D31_14125 [Candidatus Fluviicola riflensis]|nr:MAG: hypothetical protein CHH17_18560 [Candidatus Fluviicola riflensis]OGS78113.1 MAG: hypothetical protein A3D31_14125 [Candidatus Fluviicola riflensis]OGS85179.1 MAG: hypothetical protein A2724_11060 [Fluviicola sp. RIFCSPHIGHO2_01_FULL_43_53]OGS89450.1 MAG: hypothetical protein A3E30_05365 [Fluviicola sp. RIFCSPHIGHO2_12_FULL_43_24]